MSELGGFEDEDRESHALLCPVDSHTVFGPKYSLFTLLVYLFGYDIYCSVSKGIIAISLFQDFLSSPVERSLHNITFLGASSFTMRDRLAELQQKTQEFSAVATENTNPFSVADGEDDSVVLGVIKPEAVVFEEEPVIQDFLSEVEHIKDDLTVLETEVKMTTLILFLYLYISSIYWLLLTMQMMYFA